MLLHYIDCDSVGNKWLWLFNWVSSQNIRVENNLVELWFYDINKLEKNIGITSCLGGWRIVEITLEKVWIWYLTLQNTNFSELIYFLHSCLMSFYHLSHGRMEVGACQCYDGVNVKWGKWGVTPGWSWSEAEGQIWRWCSAAHIA